MLGCLEESEVNVEFIKYYSIIINFTLKNILRKHSLNQ